MRNHNPVKRFFALPPNRKMAIEPMCASHLMDTVRYPSALLDWLQELWSVRGYARPYVTKNCIYKVPHAGDDA